MVNQIPYKNFSVNTVLWVCVAGIETIDIAQSFASPERARLPINMASNGGVGGAVR